jgi:hypothetical protein
MSHLDCPHCGKRAITPLRKMFMGPASPARCRMCGEKVGLPYSAWRLWKTVLALTLVSFLFVRSLASLIVVLVAGFSVGSYLQIRLLPLVPR